TPPGEVYVPTERPTTRSSRELRLPPTRPCDPDGRSAGVGIEVGDDVIAVSAGGAVIVPGGTAHTFWNDHPERARYVLVMGARTHALVEAIHASDDRSPVAMRALFESHGAELLEP
ncbi:MAG: cupin domain-containing protein, partial [Pseudonocardia sp.]|nr:cupin domain-containing protein [Pseudonocardia sp.]